MRKITLLMAALAVSFATMAADMSGTYKVGTAEIAPNFTSLSAAVTALNAANITGNIVLEITSDITEAANVGLAVNTNGFGITIRPDLVSDPNTDPVRIITFTKTTDNTSPSGHFVIGYNALTAAWADANTIATNNVTIDGYAVGGNTKRLKFTTVSASITASKLTVIVGACQNTTIKNCIYESKSTGGSAQCIGMVTRKGTAIEVGPTGVIIDNNIITSVASASGQGINTTSSGTLTTGVTNGLIVRNNIITAQGRCAWLYYINGGDFYNNEFHLTQLGSANTVNYGLWTSTGALGTFNIYNNKFIETTTMEATASGTLGMRTMSLAAGTYKVYNNVFSGIDKKIVTAATVNLTYIFFGGTTGFISNNTFYMPALTAKTTPGYYQAITLSFANPDIKNNIFISNEDGVANAFYGSVSSGAIDYNDYYNRAGSTKSLIVSGTTNSTLALHQAANPTKDINSKSKDVNFVSTTDLHIAGASIADFDLVAPRQTTVLTDIDGDSRATLTYKGADEASDLTTIAKQFTATVPNGTAHVYIAGDFTGKTWDAIAPFELTKSATANVFSGIFPCVDGVEYQYLCEKGDYDYVDAVYDGGNDPIKKGNRTYTAADEVPIWYRVNKITLNASFAPEKGIPMGLFVQGSFNNWTTSLEMTKSGNTYSIVLGGNPGDKYPANTQYKYYTDDAALGNWEAEADGSSKGNRWSIAPVMNDVIARFTTEISTSTNNVVVTARIARTSSGIEVSLDGQSTIELYTINGMMIDKTVTSGTYSKDLNNGVYVIRINGKATKFVK